MLWSGKAGFDGLKPCVRVGKRLIILPFLFLVDQRVCSFNGAFEVAGACEGGCFRVLDPLREKLAVSPIPSSRGCRRQCPLQVCSWLSTYTISVSIPSSKSTRLTCAGSIR